MREKLLNRSLGSRKLEAWLSALSSWAAAPWTLSAARASAAWRWESAFVFHQLK